MITLKAGIEGMMKRMIPEVKGSGCGGGIVWSTYLTRHTH
ncbi:MAG: hypothetical protein WKF59_08825 [Chitinophagaceae bacterium]